jgi:hypothetical protein
MCFANFGSFVVEFFPLPVLSQLQHFLFLAIDLLPIDVKTAKNQNHFRITIPLLKPRATTLLSLQHFFSKVLPRL